MMSRYNIIIFILLCLSGLLFACTYPSVSSARSMQILPYPQWERFIKAYTIIKLHYVKPVSDENLINNAINGMLEGLDNYSTYLDASELTYLKQVTTGEFAGIGIEVMPSDDGLKVIAPLDNSPAAKAGILPADLIIAVNDRVLAGLHYREAIETLRGPAGTTVKLTIIRANVLKPLELQLTRTKLQMQNVKSRLLEKGYGDIRIGLFQQNTASDVKQALGSLAKINHGPLQGLILDLRNNPGGLLQSAVAVSNLFLDKQRLNNNHLIVYSKDRTGKIVFSAVADSEDILHNLPLIILVNQGSASGAEIVAGALHDHHRALLVGMKTFGKGSVQTVIPMDNNQDAIKLTTALYYTPAGHLIDHIGIPPDIMVKSTPQAKQDEQLARALSTIKKSVRPEESA